MYEFDRDRIYSQASIWNFERCPRNPHLLLRVTPIPVFRLFRRGQHFKDVANKKIAIKMTRYPRAVDFAAHWAEGCLP